MHACSQLWGGEATAVHCLVAWPCTEDLLGCTTAMAITVVALAFPHQSFMIFPYPLMLAPFPQLLWGSDPGVWPASELARGSNVAGGAEAAVPGRGGRRVCGAEVGVS